MKRIYYKCITSHNLDKTIFTVHNCNYLKLAFAFDFTCGIVELSINTVIRRFLLLNLFVFIYILRTSTILLPTYCYLVDYYYISCMSYLNYLMSIYIRNGFKHLYLFLHYKYKYDDEMCFTGALNVHSHRMPYFVHINLLQTILSKLFCNLYCSVKL